MAAPKYCTLGSLIEASMLKRAQHQAAWHALLLVAWWALSWRAHCLHEPLAPLLLLGFVVWAVTSW